MSTINSNKLDNVKSTELKKQDVTEDITKKVIDVIRERFDLSEEKKVTLESEFSRDLGADSLDSVEVIMAFEEEFQCEIPDSEAEKFTKVGDIVQFITNNRKETSS